VAEEEIAMSCVLRETVWDTNNCWKMLLSVVMESPSLKWVLENSARKSMADLTYYWQ